MKANEILANIEAKMGETCRDNDGWYACVMTAGFLAEILQAKEIAQIQAEESWRAFALESQKKAWWNAPKFEATTPAPLKDMRRAKRMRSDALHETKKVSKLLTCVRQKKPNRAAEKHSQRVYHAEHVKALRYKRELEQMDAIFRLQSVATGGWQHLMELHALLGGAKYIARHAHLLEPEKDAAAA